MPVTRPQAAQTLVNARVELYIEEVGAIWPPLLLSGFSYLVVVGGNHLTVERVFDRLWV
jgi:hypothetical protein